MVSLNFVLLLSILGASGALVCPPAEEIRPCLCEEDIQVIRCSQNSSDPTAWDIKATFDRMSTLIPEDTVFAAIYIHTTQLKEIPPGAFEIVKFREIHIEYNFDLAYIHPEAFNATLETTTSLWIVHNPITNVGEGHTSDEFFNVLQKFRNIKYLYINDNGDIALPDEALGTLPLLEHIKAGNINNNKKLIVKNSSDGNKLLTSQVTQFGSRVFAGNPKLTSADLSYLDISLEDIAEDAFEGIAASVYLRLEGNPIRQLPEIPFKQLLDTVTGLTVGGRECNPIICYDLHLDCNEVSEWICRDVEKYRGKLTGFTCRLGSFYNDIFDYCARLIIA